MGRAWIIPICGTCNLPIPCATIARRGPRDVSQSSRCFPETSAPYGGGAGENRPCMGTPPEVPPGLPPDGYSSRVPWVSPQANPWATPPPGYPQDTPCMVPAQEPSIQLSDPAWGIPIAEPATLHFHARSLLDAVLSMLPNPREACQKCLPLTRGSW